MTYESYISSSRWQAKRLERLHHDNFTCVRCGETERLHVHHVSYHRLYDESIGDLLTLCADCHAREHGRDPDLPSIISLKTAFRRSMDAGLEREALEDQQAEILAHAMGFGDYL